MKQTDGQTLSMFFQNEQTAN